MPRMKILLACAVLAASVSLFWCFSSPEEDRGGGRRIASADAKGPSRAGPWFDPQPGFSYEYGFRRRIEIGGLNNSFPPIEYTGQLSLDIVSSDTDTFEAVAREHVDGQAGGVRFRIVANRAGDRLELFEPEKKESVDYSHESVMKDVLSLLFFPLKNDTTGNYSASIESSPANAGLRRFRKQKIAYTDAPKVKILSSSHSMVWGQDLAMPQTVEGMDKTRLGGQIETKSAYRIVFQAKVAAAKPSAGELASLGRKESLALKPQKISLKDHPDYAGLSWAEVADRLRGVSSLSSSEQLKLFGDLVKLLQMGGAKASDLLAMLRSGKEISAGAKSVVFQQVVGALATNGSSDAQAALVELYQEPGLPVSGKGSILGAFTTTQAPLDPPTRSFLEAQMEGEGNKDLAEGAAFALGASLEKAPNDAEAAEAVERILAAWNSASSVEERLVLLDAMGNSGRAEFFPAISSALVANNEQRMRAKAAFSLRFMRNEPAIAALANSLFDADTAVRTGAARGIEVAPWSETFRDPVNSCSANESDAEVRRLCVSVLSHHSHLAQAD